MSTKSNKAVKTANPKEKRPMLGPGPNAYRLPTTVGYHGHDPSRYRNPMYSFRGRDIHERLHAKPESGPEYKIQRITHHGPITSPAYSFGHRFPSRANKFPGPGAHAPERAPPTIHTRPPMYSFGAQLNCEVKKPGPGPNAYKLSRMAWLSTPAWSMGTKPKGRSDIITSPGPAEYWPKNLNVYLIKEPSYSLGAGRLGGREKSYKTPSPACYSTNLYDLYSRKKDQYSFGRKHSEYAPPLIIKEDIIHIMYDEKSVFQTKSNENS